MIIKSDWHIHSEHSYDAQNALELIVNNAKEQGLTKIGITDHVNFNDKKFLADMKSSVKAVKEAQKTNAFMVLGVELTPIEKPEFDYIKKRGVRDGYVAPNLNSPFDIELAVSKSDLIKNGIRYAIGAAHWRVDVPSARYLSVDLEASIREWHRQQMWLANDERVTILGHPWYHGQGIWYEDFSLIPRSMHDEFIDAMKKSGKYVECNSHFFWIQTATEKFRHQYAEFLREMFEKGIRITYGSDSHENYADKRPLVEKYLVKVGFREGDFSELTEEDLW